MSQAAFAAQARLLFPWMPESLIQAYANAWVETGDPNLALQEVRFGEGREAYDATFPGIRREDGTLRLTENEYLSDMQQFRNTLSEYGLNPEVFSDRLVTLVENEVDPETFARRVDSIQTGIVNRSEEVREAFAQASGLAPSDLSDEALLAAAIDPDGVGNRIFQQEINIAQIRGTAREFGFERSRAEVEEILERTSLNIDQAVDFYSSAQDRLGRLNTIQDAFIGTDRQDVDIEDLEEGFLQADVEEARRLERLILRERSAFSSQNIIQSSNTGALLGLRNNRR